MFNIFKKDDKQLLTPMKGQVIPIDQVDDPVFSGKMLGDGFAVIPDEGSVYAPCDGTILQVFNTKHALVIKSQDGLEVILHMGLETVELKGQGFDVHVKEGDRVKAGQVIVTMDLAYIIQQGKKTVTPFVITNMDKIKSLKVKVGQLEIGDIALEYRLNK